MVYCQILTNKGTLTAELFYLDARQTVDNFIQLANDDFYEGLEFYKKIENTAILTGCSNNDGSTNLEPGIPKETHLGCQYHDKGVLSMLPKKDNPRKESNKTQFMICLSREEGKKMDRYNTAFGVIKEGKEILNQLEEGDTIETIIIDDQRKQPSLQNVQFKL